MRTALLVRLFALLPLFVANQTRAVSIVWTNVAGGNWNVAANWSPNQLPTANDDVFITNNGTYAVLLNVASTNGTLTVGGSSGTQTLTNATQTLTVLGAVLFNPNGRLGVSGGTIASSNTFTMNGGLIWNNAGTLGGTNTLVLNTPLTLVGAGTKTLSGKTLINNSTITHTAGIFSTTAGATISNTPAGIFDVASDVGVTAAAGVRFFNAGLIRKSAGVGTSVLAPILNSTGTVEVQTGTLQLDGSTVTNAGSCTVATGATLVVSPTTGTFLAGSTVSGAGNFTMSGSGTLEMLGSISISGTNTVTAGGTTVNFSGSTYSLNGGTLTTSSAINVNFNGTGTAAPAVVNMAGNIGGSNNITISGLFTWTGGNLIGSGSVTANGGIYYPVGSARGLNGRTLINNATMTWEGGPFGLTGGAIFSNAPAATVNLTTGVNLTSAIPNDLFLNAGTFRKTSDDPVTKSIAGKFINTGTVEIQGGGLLFTGSATNTGTYLISAGATLELSGTAIGMAAGSTISGAGNFSVVGGNSDLAGSLSVGGTNTVIGGTANFSGGNYTISDGTLNILSGNANFNGTGTVTPAILNMSGGNLGGSNNVSVSGFFTWSGGNMIGSGNVTANGGLLYTGGNVRSITGRTLINTATATWDSQNINLNAGAVISNAPGAIFSLSTGLDFIGSAGVFANAGTFRKTSVTNRLTLVGCVFNNSGLVEIQAGGMQFNNSGTHSGSFEVFAGATLDLSATTGTNTLTAGSSINNAGNFTVSGGTANLSGALAVSGTNTFSAGTANFTGTYSLVNGAMNISGGTANFNGDGVINPVALNFTSGTLGGSNNVTVNGPIIWTSGTITGTNSVIANGGLTVTGAGAKNLTSRSLVNSASAVMTNSGNITLASGAVVSNAPAGIWDFADDVNLTGSGAVANGGVFRKSVGSLSTINVPFVNSGTMESLSGLIGFTGSSVFTQTAGLTLLNGGNLTNTAPLRIQGGTLAGIGTVFGSVTNSGFVSPGSSPGQLVIFSNYVQTAAGTLNVELAGSPASTNYDRLVANNSMTLDGTLNVTLTNGYYPAPDLVFTNVLRAASRSGTFATVNFPASLVGLQANYGATNVDIEIINTLPSLPPIANQTIDELTTLNFNVNATDSDAPAQTLTYALVNSPTNAAINPAGQLTWTPTEAQGPLTTNITVVVTDNGTPNLTTNVTFQVVVREINVPPVLTLPATASINEQVPYTANATATDSDIPTNSLTFGLVSGPLGLTVSSAGAIAWTPLEAQGSNTYTVTIFATDTNALAFNATSLSVTNSYQIVVNEVNLPPSLTPPANQVITEQTPLTNVVASATDPDSPANPLTFSLASPPGGMIINPASGVISWTPDESQGSNSYTIKVVVTDTNVTAVNAKFFNITNTFNITVNESNRPPVLTVPGPQTITEEATLSVSATATDPDLPTNALVFSLVSPPAGMAINTNTGAINWTPTEAQGSNSYTITVVVTDTNAAAINAKFFQVTNSFSVVVNESNRPPVLTLPGPQTINELVLYTNNATATDPDLPANGLVFALVSGPAGLVVTPAGGISWTPDETQGPTNISVQIKVTDTNPLAINATSLSVTNSYNLTVSEVNLAPQVGALSDQAGNPGQTISFTATATDADLPTNTLSFSLVTPPAGASIVPSSGLFTWRLPVAFANTTNLLRVAVTDNGSPIRSGTNSFNVIVNSIGAVVLSPLSYSNGLFRLSVTGGLGPDYILQGSVSLTNYADLLTNTPVAMPFTLTNASAFSNRFYRVRLSP